MPKRGFYPNGSHGQQDGAYAGREVPWISFVLCGEHQRRSEVEADALVEQVLGAAYRCERVLSGSETFVVSRGHRLVGLLSHMPAPLDEADANMAIASADHFWWPDGSTMVAAHESFVTVVVNDEENLEPVPAATTLTRLTLVALKYFDGFGVYWPQARLCNSRRIFERFAAQMTEDRLPVPLWVRLHLQRNPDQSLSAYTFGMHQFERIDFEIDRCNLTASELLEFLWDLANNALIQRQTIRDGDVVVGRGGRRVRVRRGSSRSEPRRQVYKLLF